MYTVKGSNTGYKVMGILSIVFAGLEAVVLGFLCLVMFAGGVTASSYIGSEEGVGTSALLLVLALLILIVNTFIKVDTGVVLIKKYNKTKGIFIWYAVLAFLATVVLLVFMILCLVGAGMIPAYMATAISVSTMTTVSCLIKMLWDLTIGIILLLKQSACIPVSDMHHLGMDRTGSEAKTLYNPVVGSIEGMFGGFQGRTYQLHEGESCIIGRDSSCQIQLNNPKIGRKHCVVRKISYDTWQITDYSTNGTFYENNRMLSGIPTNVKSGGMLVIAEPNDVLQLK